MYNPSFQGYNGKEFVEIKCPRVCLSEVPSHSNCCYLEATETGSSLSKKSSHYFQIQGQLAATGLQYRDFCYMPAVATTWNGLITTDGKKKYLGNMNVNMKIKNQLSSTYRTK